MMKEQEKGGERGRTVKMEAGRSKVDKPSACLPYGGKKKGKEEMRKDREQEAEME